MKIKDIFTLKPKPKVEQRNAPPIKKKALVVNTDQQRIQRETDYEKRITQRANMRRTYGAK